MFSPLYSGASNIFGILQVFKLLGSIKNEKVSFSFGRRHRGKGANIFHVKISIFECRQALREHIDQQD